MSTSTMDAKVVEVPPVVVETEEGPRFSRKDTLLTMLSVLAVMLLASLDQTIVGTAMPRVIADLKGFDRYTWVTTAYLLASTVMVPIYGKLSDLLGRKPVFIFGIIVFLIGSALCGASQTMDQLIIFRAVQGFGAAALMPIAMAIVGDLFTPRERARWQGVTGGVFALSALVGPTAGGWITENTSWHWVFFVNLPLGIVALLLLIFVMPVLKGRAKEVKIDYLGSALLVVATVPLLLGFTWAGSQYEWTSVEVISALGVALIGTVTFVIYESWLARTNGQPIIEPALFKNSIFTISVIMTMISSIAMFGSIFFLPLFVQGVLGTSLTGSGLVLTPMMLSMIATSIISGQIVAATGKYKALAVTGAVIVIVGVGLLLQLGLNSTNFDVIVAMIVLGVGIGMGMSLYTLIVQNAFPTKIGQATSTLVFFRSIGGTVALSIMGSLMNSAYLPTFQAALPADVVKTLPAAALASFHNPQILLSPEAYTQISQQFNAMGSQGQAIFQTLLAAVKIALVEGIHTVFIVSFIVALAGLVAVMFLKQIELRGGPRKKSSEPAHMV